MTPTIRLTWTKDADPSLPLPSYETGGAAGADLRANLPDRAPITLEPGARRLIPTGLHVEIPPGFEMQIRPRSGLALKQGLSLANAPGTIDSDYRGPLGVILINLGQAPVYDRPWRPHRPGRHRAGGAGAVRDRRRPFRNRAGQWRLRVDGAGLMALVLALAVALWLFGAAIKAPSMRA